ncbi:MAG: zinc-dependent peptidase [Aquabacterium sp.]
MPLLLLTLTALVLAVLIGRPLWVARQRRHLRAQPMPPFWLRVLQRRVPLVARLPAALQADLHARMRVFLADKAFIGCRGLEVTEEMRVTVAALACLPILGRDETDYDRVRQILLYPDAFLVRVRHQDRDGVVFDGEEARAGESWHEGQVVLSWADILDSAAVPDDGYNVVIHEFAHQLDDAHGLSTDLELDTPPHAWAAVLGAAYRRLVEAADQDDDTVTLLDPYGATDPCEFFAVASEAFFEQPARLAEDDPALYAQLQRFYRLDPARWAPDAPAGASPADRVAST